MTANGFLPPILGLLERETGEIRAKVAPNRKKHEVHSHVNQNVSKGAKLFTDSFTSYMDLTEDYAHHIVDHLEAYVRGRVHTNTIENFWSLLKRTLGGTYVSVDPHHLFRYLDEQMFRFNRRGLNDTERFVVVMAQTIGRRVTYNELIARTGVSRNHVVLPWCFMSPYQATA